MKYVNFRELLKLEDKYPSFRQAIIEGLIDTRRFKPVRVGDYYLSIQASRFFYCTPRQTLEDIYQYKAMEIAILQDDEGRTEFIRPCEDKILKGFSRYGELCEFYHVEKVVGSYVPIDLIQDLYEYLSEIYGG